MTLTPRGRPRHPRSATDPHDALWVRKSTRQAFRTLALAMKRAGKAKTFDGVLRLMMGLQPYE